MTDNPNAIPDYSPTPEDRAALVRCHHETMEGRKLITQRHVEHALRVGPWLAAAFARSERR